MFISPYVNMFNFTPSDKTVLPGSFVLLPPNASTLPFFNETIKNGSQLLNNSFYQTLRIDCVSSSSFVPFYESPLAGVILGAVLTFFFTYILDWFKEKKELEKYESRLLLRIVDVLDCEKGKTLKKKISGLVAQVAMEPEFDALAYRTLVISTLTKAKEGKTCDKEINKINHRINQLQRGVLGRVWDRLKKLTRYR